MRKTILFLSVFLLAACVGNAPRPSSQSLYDLGELPDSWSSPGFPIVSVEVRSSSWLSGVALLYRLMYADPLRRLAYAESRWAAPPADLLERHLRRRIVYGQPDYTAAGCRLRLTLDEFEQRFDTAQASQAVVVVSASLLPRNGEVLLAKRNFTVRQSAPTPDAHGGVIAARQAVDALAADLSGWLQATARERPQSVATCKEMP